LIVSGTLSDVSSQDSITPDNFPLSPPVATRYLQFRALTDIYGTGNVGLNEIQAIADAAGARQSIARAVLLTWPCSPFNVVLESSPDSSTWTPVAAQPILVGNNWELYQPISGLLYYRLSAP
jgi:hypothetical protein